MQKKKVSVVSQKSRSVRIPRSVARQELPRGFPKSLVAHLKYHQYATIDPAAGAVGSYVFRANSVFDPDYTSTGHQPLGYDQLSALYSHYTVLSSNIQVTFLPASTLVATILGIQLGADYTLTGAWPVITEQASTHWKKVTGSGSSVYPDLPVVKHRFNSKDFFGVQDPNGDRELGAAIGSNPNDGAYFNLFIQAADQSADLPLFHIVVELDYEVMFSEREEVPAS